MFEKNTISLHAKTLTGLLNNTITFVRKHGRPWPNLPNDYSFVENVLLILDEPNQDLERYPIWDLQAEDWFMNIFSRTTHGPFEKAEIKLIFPYTYAWRGRFNDHGWGYVDYLVRIFLDLQYSNLQIDRQADLDQLVRETYPRFHPDLLLAIFSWLGLSRLQAFLNQPELTQTLIDLNRRDLIQEMIDQLTYQRDSYHRSAAVSLAIPGIDFCGMLEKPLSHQGYSIYRDDQSGQTAVVQSLRWQHQLDLEMVQLEFAHEREWGLLIANQLDLPLNQISIWVNQLIVPKEENANAQNDHLRHRLMQKVLALTTAYDPDQIDIEKFLEHPRYVEKSRRLIQQLHANHT